MDLNYGGLHERPWGGYVNHASGTTWHLKTLHFKPESRVSLQKHAQRSETWVLTEGDASATTGDSLDNLQSVPMEPHVPMFIPAGTLHRLSTQNGCTIVEIMQGTYDENDIERFEDDYGRV